MDDNKRRAFIRKQVAKRAKKHSEGVVPLTRETTQMKPFIKRKLMDKGDRPPKKPMEVVVTTVGEKPVATQVPLPCYGISKGLMTTKGPILEQPPPPFFVRIHDMLWGFCCPSSRTTTMKTWATMPLRPWGSRVSLAWLRSVTILLAFRSSTIVLNSNCLLTSYRGC